MSNYYLIIFLYLYFSCIFTHQDTSFFSKTAKGILTTSPLKFNPNYSSGQKTTQVVIFILFYIFISALWKLHILITALSQFFHFMIGKDSDKLFKHKNAPKLIYSKKIVTEHKYNILFLSIQKNRTQIVLNPLFVEFFLIWSYFQKIYFCFTLISFRF